MKIIPKGAKFCPGCPSKLSLKPAPQIVIKAEEKHNDSRAITIVGTSKKKSDTASLF